MESNNDGRLSQNLKYKKVGNYVLGNKNFLITISKENM
jgi:hypothetical protein